MVFGRPPRKNKSNELLILIKSSDCPKTLETKVISMVAFQGLEVPMKALGLVSEGDGTVLPCCFRGIDVVRNKIKMFAQQKVTLPKGRHKIMILDEADR